MGRLISDLETGLADKLAEPVAKRLRGAELALECSYSFMVRTVDVFALCRRCSKSFREGAERIEPVISVDADIVDDILAPIRTVEIAPRMVHIEEANVARARALLDLVADKFVTAFRVIACECVQHRLRYG